LHDRLDGDAAQDVADRDAEVVAERGTHRDGHLRKVRRNREEDHPAQRLPEVQPFRKHVCHVGQLNPSDPDRTRGRAEDAEKERKRQIVEHEMILFLEAGMSVRPRLSP
jgi:hypothetical protein